MIRTSSVSSMQCQVTSLTTKTPRPGSLQWFPQGIFSCKGKVRKAKQTNVLAGRQIGKEYTGKQSDGKLLASSSKVKIHPTAGTPFWLTWASLSLDEAISLSTPSPLSRPIRNDGRKTKLTPPQPRGSDNQI